MKRFFLFIVGLWVCIGVFAQEGKEIQLYKQAEEAYKIGRFEEAIKLLSANLNDFSVRTKETSLKLLALCYLEEDKMAEAEQYASMLLKYNPYYTVGFSDPLRFADMIDRLKKGQATITTASQQAETLEEAPVPVTLITEEMIKVSGAKNLADLLILYVPGISLVEGDEMNVSMHGVYSSSQEKILIMLNGHRLNSRATNSEAPDYRTCLNKIKQIEVLRGPASSLYGNVALTAVVNIITKSGKDIDGAKLSIGTGSNHTYQADIVLGKGGLEWDVMAWASVYTSKGEKRNIDVDDDEFWGKIEEPGSLYIGGYNHKPSYDLGCTFKWNNLSFLFNTQYSKRVTSYNTVLYPGLFSYDQYRLINGVKPGRSRQATHAEVSYENTWGKWTGKLTAFFDMENCTFYDVGGDSILPDDRFLPDIGSDEIISGLEINAFDSGIYQVQSWSDYTYGVTAVTNYGFHINNFPATLLLGAQFENYSMQDNSFLIGDHFDRIILTYSGRNSVLKSGNEINLSGFTQLKTDLGERFIFNGGLRYDYKKRYNERKLNAFSPRISLIYKIKDGMNLKASYAHSFVDAPYFYRASTIATYSGGSKLDAEKMDAFQLDYTGIIRQWNLNYEVNIFYNRLNNLIYYDMSKMEDMYSNAGKLDLMGVEGVLSYKSSSSMAYMKLLYQYVLNSRNYVASGKNINNFPSFQMNGMYSYNLLKGERTGQLSPWLNVSVLSKQYSPLVDPYLYRGEENQVYLPDNVISARVIVNVGANYFYKKWGLSVGVYNLFNTDYYQGGSCMQPLPQQRLNFLAKILYEF